VSSTGRSGGLGVFWNNETSFQILPFSQYHIDAVISEAGSTPWRFTCIYGEAQVAERFKTWDLLKHIKASNDLPWMCIGDFNEVLHQHEHDGVGDRSLGQIVGFRDAVDVCELVDLGFEGSMWTFEKRVVGGSFCSAGQGSCHPGMECTVSFGHGKPSDGCYIGSQTNHPQVG
jgi:hypothetical protein